MSTTKLVLRFSRTMCPPISTCAQSGGGGGSRRSISSGHGWSRFWSPGGSVPRRTRAISQQQIRGVFRPRGYSYDVALAVNVAVAADDQHSGTWKMNPAKSKYSPGPAAKSVNLKIESDENGIKIDAEGTDGDGNPTHVQYDATVAVKRIDTNTIQSTLKKAGQVVMTVTSTVSNYGKMRTSTFKGKDAQGRDVNNVVVKNKKKVD